MAKNKNFLRILGIMLMVLGGLIVLSAFPLIQMSIVSVGPVTAEVSEISATRIIIGVVFFFLGLISYKNK